MRAGGRPISLPLHITLVPLKHTHAAWPPVPQAHERVVRLLYDVFELLCVFYHAWDAYKFVLATLVFGALVPVELVGRLLGRLGRCCGPGGTSREGVSSTSTNAPKTVVATPRQFQLGGLAWLGLLAYPCVVVYYAAPRLAAEPAEAAAASAAALDAAGSAPEGLGSLRALVGAYASVLVCLGLCSSVAALSLREDRLIAIRFPRRTLRLSSANVVAVGSVLLDGAQIMALPFLALREVR